VNLGNDADTTGAIYGQLAGAFYGADAIPEDWVERLARHEFIAETADALFDLSTA
jgi:ADP-ribosyl-[dinitrogen reductase] hydrolase